MAKNPGKIVRLKPTALKDLENIWAFTAER
jgi:plasmid stabilization system protein ParE